MSDNQTRPNVREPWRADLAAPFRSFRLMAYEEALRHGHTDDLLRELHERLLVEDDPECRMLLEYAIAAVARRVAPQSAGVIVGKDGTPRVPATDHEFVTELKRVDPAQRLELILGCDEKRRAALAVHAPDLLVGETDPVVGAALVRTFAKHWPQERLDVLTSRLLAPHLGLQMAVLESLVTLAPQHLVKQLPLFLSSPEPRLRALAVWGLVAVDPDEALQHLQGMLLGSETRTKMAAIGNLFLLPFESVKPVLLQFLAAEQDLELLEEAGALVAMNPDLDMPFTLATMAEQSWPQKTALLERLVDAAAEAVEAAGLSGTDHAGYLARLASFRERRSAMLFVQDWLTRLDAADADVEIELVALMRVCIGGEPVRLALREARLWNLTPKARQILDRVLAAGPVIDAVPVSAPVAAVKVDSQSGTVAPTVGAPSDDAAPASAVPVEPASPVVVARKTAAPPPPPERKPETTVPAPVDTHHAPVAATPADPGHAPSAVATEPWAELSLTGKIQRIASWRSADLPAIKPQLTEILRDRQSPAALRAAALRPARRREGPGVARGGETGLHNASPHHVNAPHEYLARHGTDVIVPVLGKFLNAPDPWVRATALQVLRHFDGGQALSTVRALLQSQSEDHRRSALASIVQFDWVLVRDTLCDFLASRPSAALRDEALGLFELNPDVANMYPLYRLSRLLEGEARDAAKATLDRCRDQLLELGMIAANQMGTLEQEWARRWGEEQTRRQAPPPAYSRRAMQAGRGQGASDSAETLSWPAWIIAGIHHAFVTAPIRSAVLLIALVGLGLLCTSFVADEEAPEGPRPGPVAGASETKVEGRIEAVTPDMLTVRTSEGNLMHIQGEKNWTRGYATGNHVAGWVLPIMIDKDGATVARVVMIRKRD